MDIQNILSMNINNDMPVKPKKLESPEKQRSILLNELKNAKFLQPNDPNFFHGRMNAQDESLTTPKKVWVNSSAPRDDHTDGKDRKWLTATEFQDLPCISSLKVEQLAKLLKLSKKTVIYSGAGISVAASINMAAKGSSKTSKLKATRVDWKKAKPTLTHHALRILTEHGLVHRWIQQNHDGLPQKAGFPQELINEIHGGWHDPSNPVVVYSGQLRSELYKDMENQAETADLVLVLGTSLSGLNADQVAQIPGERSRKGLSLGTVIINLQQTPKDGIATLRMFDKTDDVFKKLLTVLGLEKELERTKSMYSRPVRKVLVPYDSNGRKTQGRKMWLNLNDGAAIKLAKDNNCKGSGQPSYKHIDSYSVGKVNGKRDELSAFDISIGNKGMLLGQWWLKAAEEGKIPILPVVNVNPVYE